MPNRLKIALSRASGAASESAARIAYLGVGWGLRASLVAIGAAAGAWSLAHPAKLAGLDTNKLTEPERIQGLIWLGITLAALLFVYGATLVVRRARSGLWLPGDTGEMLSRALFPLAGLPFVAALRLPNIERDSPKQTLFYAAIAAATVLPALYGRPGAPLGSRVAEADPDELPLAPGAAPRRSGRRAELAKKALAALWLGALWIGYGLFFSRLSITNHHALNTRTTDLGYYDNIFYQSIHGNPLGCSFIKGGYHGSAHFDPLLVLLSPLYLIYPHAELLLVLQSFWLGLGVVPVYLLAKHEVGSRGIAATLATSWVLYPALHGANMYEFHSLALIAPLVPWLIYFIRIAAWNRFALVYAALLLTREDVALLLSFVAIWLLLSGGRTEKRLGWTMIAINVVWFAIVKAFFMASSALLNTGKGSYGFAYYYEAMIPNKTGAAGLFTSLVTNPVFALKTALDEPKLLFFVTLFLPLLFIPFLARQARVMLFYGLFFCLLASRKAVYSIHFQYSCLIFPIAFCLVPMALRQVREGRVLANLGLDGHRFARAAVGASLVATALVSWKHGAIVDNATFKGGFSRVARSLTEQQKQTHAWVRRQADAIPKQASVAATGKLGPHVSNRKQAFFYPEKQNTDYVFLDETELRGPELERHKKAVLRGELVEVSRHGRMALLKRKPRDPSEPAPAPVEEPPSPTEGEEPQQPDAE